MATYSNSLARKTPWTEAPCGLQSIYRVSTLVRTEHTHIYKYKAPSLPPPWTRCGVNQVLNCTRRKWQVYIQGVSYSCSTSWVLFFWTLGKIMLLFMCQIKVYVYELSHCHNLTLVTALWRRPNHFHFIDETVVQRGSVAASGSHSYLGQSCSFDAMWFHWLFSSTLSRDSIMGGQGCARSIKRDKSVGLYFLLEVDSPEIPFWLYCESLWFKDPCQRIIINPV